METIGAKQVFSKMLVLNTILHYFGHAAAGAYLMNSLCQFTRDQLKSIPKTAKYFFSSFKDKAKISSFQLPFAKPNEASSLYTDFTVECEFSKRTLEILIQKRISNISEIRFRVNVNTSNFKFLPHMLVNLSQNSNTAVNDSEAQTQQNIRLDIMVTKPNVITFEVFQFIDSIKSNGWEIKNLMFDKMFMETEISSCLSKIISLKCIKFKVLEISGIDFIREFCNEECFNPKYFVDAGIEQLKLICYNYNYCRLNQNELKLFELLRSNAKHFSVLKELEISFNSFSFNLNLFIETFCEIKTKSDIDLKISMMNINLYSYNSSLNFSKSSIVVAKNEDGNLSAFKTSELNVYILSDINLINCEDQIVFTAQNLCAACTIDSVVDETTIKIYEKYFKECSDANYMIITEVNFIELSTNLCREFTTQFYPLLNIPPSQIDHYTIRFGHQSNLDECCVEMANLIDPKSTIALDICDGYNKVCFCGSPNYQPFYNSHEVFINALPLQNIVSISSVSYLQIIYLKFKII